MKKVGLKGKRGGNRNNINQKLMSLANSSTIEGTETVADNDPNKSALLGASPSQANAARPVPHTEDVANLINKIKQAVDSKKLNPDAVRQVMEQAGGSVPAPLMSQFGPLLRLGGPHSDFPPAPRMSNSNNFPMRVGGPPWRGNMPLNMPGPPQMCGPPRLDGPPNMMGRGRPPMDGPPIGNPHMPPGHMDRPRQPRMMGPNDGPPPLMGARFDGPPRPMRMGGPMNRLPFDGHSSMMGGHNKSSQGSRRSLKS